MGAGASVKDLPFESAEAALAAGKTQEEIDAWMAKIAEAEAKIATVDQDGDGKLDAKELTDAGIPESEVAAEIKKADVDGDGKISAPEMVQQEATEDALAASEADAKLVEAKALVASLDKDGDGKLDAKELMEAGMSEADAAAQIKKADVDGDGKVSAEELVQQEAAEKALAASEADAKLAEAKVIVDASDKDADKKITVARKSGEDLEVTVDPKLTTPAEIAAAICKHLCYSETWKGAVSLEPVKEDDKSIFFKYSGDEMESDACGMEGWADDIELEFCKSDNTWCLLKHAHSHAC